MQRLSWSPGRWLMVGLLAMMCAGAVVLYQPACTPRDEREQRFFACRIAWECTFDALSAACGAGLLTRDIRDGYSPAGRWVLWTLGELGALLYLTTAVQLARRFPQTYAGLPSGTAASAAASGGAKDRNARPAIPTRPLRAAWIGVAAGAFVLMQLLLTLGVYAAGRFICPQVNLAETAWLVGVAFASLGFVPQPVEAGTAAMLAAVGWVSALGWTVWLCLLPPLARRVVVIRGVLLLAAVYTLYLLAAGGLICVLETPRAAGQTSGFRVQGSVEPRTAAKVLHDEPSVGGRARRSLVLAVCAASAGIPTEPLQDPGVRDGTKAVLAGLLLVGGLGGSVTGGVRFLALLSAMLFALRFAARPNARALRSLGTAATTTNAATSGSSEAGARSVDWMAQLGARLLLLLLGLTLATALGLLVIENLTASRFQPAPSFADALLDGASAVCGGNLSGGVTAAVTGRNLVRGLGLGLDQYQAGMLWLMLAVLAGRLLPLWLLGQEARAPAPSMSHSESPE